ncbi:hypothetical protein [Actinoplanes sp. URMC 104]|uniref:hypothetical protein n=1 Tax=Actinoplanes sp. URMC 104 TaxID=3423409 RepID=UPI003F1BC357
MADTQTVALKVDERVYATKTRWQVFRDDVRIVDISHKPGEVDPHAVTVAIAEHFGVEASAVEQMWEGRSRLNTTGRRRWLPKTVHVRVPAAAAEPDRCEHDPGEAGCWTDGCSGYPPVDTPLDRDRIEVPLFATKWEFGDVTEARALATTIGRETGMHTQRGGVYVANNGWADVRQGERKVHGVTFQASDPRPGGMNGSYDVRVLSYEGRASALSSATGWFAAVYVGGRCVEAGIDQERGPHAARARIVEAVVGALDHLWDEVELAAVAGGVRTATLKNPPVGFAVDTGEHGVCEVVERSTNDGVTLRVRDAGGTFRFVDRPRNAWWSAKPVPDDAEPVAAAAPAAALEGAGEPDGVGELFGELLDEYAAAQR